MKLLLDANLSPRLADLLDKQGIESVHREHGLQHADDESIFDFAAEGDYVLVSEDTDFGRSLPSAMPVGHRSSCCGPVSH